MLIFRFGKQITIGNIKLPSVLELAKNFLNGPWQPNLCKKY